MGSLTSEDTPVSSREEALEDKPFGKYVLSMGRAVEYDLVHASGMCGSPVMGVINGRSVLLGIHSAGEHDTNRAFGCMFNPDLVKKALNKFKNGDLTDVFSEGTVTVPSHYSHAPVTPRSCLHYEDVPGLRVGGSLGGYAQVSPRSKLEISPLYSSINKLIGESPEDDEGKIFLPPAMRHRWVDDKYCAPYNQWIKKLGVVKNELNPKAMSVCAQTLSEYILEELRKKDVESVSPVDMMVAINGSNENFYMRSMKMSTSAGFLYPGKKEKYIHRVFKENSEVEFVPKLELQRRVLDIVGAYEKCERAHDLLGAQLKDEPRSREKVVLCKTRVFAMSSFPNTIVNRMYLMPFYSMMCELRDIFHTKVGVNMHGLEGGRIRSELLAFSPFLMEGDYGGYDTSMPVGIGLTANTIVVKCLRALGYNNYALQMVRGILSDNLYPTLVMEGNIVVAPGFQPSGRYATAEDNSLRGIILLQYAYLVLCTEIGIGHPMNGSQKFSPKDFFKYVKPYVYGDDMICAVKPEISNLFNCITYSLFVKYEYGMEFTTANKGKHEYEFIYPNEISFLKRHFMYSPILKREVAVLDKQSMVKSLMYRLPSDVTADVWAVEVSSSILRELFFYCKDEYEYNNYRAKFVEAIDESTSTILTKDVDEFLPTFTDIFMSLN